MQTISAVQGHAGLRALAIGVGALVLELLRRVRVRPSGVPIIPGQFLLGSLLSITRAVARKEQNEFFLQQHWAFGQTWAAKVPFMSWMIVTTRPENVKHVLKDNFESYPKGPRLQGLKELLGHGIFISDGEEWHSQRKTASLIFTAKLFREHIWVVVRRNARKLRDIFEAVEPGKVLDVYNVLNRFTLDTIGEIGFGKCIGSLEDPSSPFLRSFDRTQQISFQRLFTPFWPLLRLLGLGFERETREHFRRVDSYSRSVVRELCEGIAEGSGKGKGVAWADIEAQKSFVGVFVKDALARGEHLSEDFLRDLVLNFLLAGRDTTAHALSWTFYCLALHPDAETRARQEVSEVCGVRGPAYEDLGRLPYLQAVLSEVLRLYPSVPFDAKTAARDDTLPDGTFVPRGSGVAYNIYSMGRDRAIWGADAEEFRPERWLEMEEVPSNYDYPVFNAGPRECLGRRLAQVEMKACLATLLPHVSLRLAVPREQICPDAQLSIGMGRGLPCFVEQVADREKDFGSSASTVAQSDCVSTLSEGTSAAPERPTPEL
mmetsp:Transcript_38822/g.112143  ORF Transcript_38822/g.112143 Transcript_38822/m.112143 type:complete len:545 (-) Transcript_38822:197-1831(-)